MINTPHRKQRTYKKLIFLTYHSIQLLLQRRHSTLLTPSIPIRTHTTKYITFQQLHLPTRFIYRHASKTLSHHSRLRTYKILTYHFIHIYNTERQTQRSKIRIKLNKFDPKNTLYFTFIPTKIN